ncbi:MAG TPA: hypothetical protein VLN56_01770, partial [Gammaproteobacteria bacterium]|nr:hypothetical protein [Gammaproteobacteria bacterium]
SQPVTIAMMCSGLAVVVGWRYLEWQNHIYEGMPGILTGLLVYAVCSIVKIKVSGPVKYGEES